LKKAEVKDEKKMKREPGFGAIISRIGAEMAVPA